MSRAAIIIVARHFLRHDPSPDEYEAARKLLLSLCPGGRLYIPSEEPPQPSMFNDAADLKRNGWSIRKIAKKLGISKSQVHRQLSRETVATVDTIPPNVQAQQEA
jgi:AraC-like DNA-binding protein